MKIAEKREATLLRQIEAFRLRYVEKLTLKVCGERIGRAPGYGSGPICTERVRQLAMSGVRRLSHPSADWHPLHKKACEVRARIWPVRRLPGGP